jgi:hypothetical protein
MRVGMNGVYRMSPGANEIPAGVRAVCLHTKERTYEAGLTLIGISDTVRK